jgi:hypothetical protein
MNSDVPRPEKVLQEDEKARHHLSHVDASPNSYYQLLLQKCRSRPGTWPGGSPLRRTSCVVAHNQS